METNNQNNQAINRPSMNQAPRPRMTFRQAVGACISNYATFTGRARRSEFWWFYLFMVIIVAIPLLGLTAVALIFEGHIPVDPNHMNSITEVVDVPLGVLLGIICMFLIIPTLAVQVRRLHDTGRSGKWVLWGILSRLPYSITSGIVLNGVADKSRFEIMNVIQGFHVSAVGGSLMLIFSLLSWGVSLVLLVFMLQDSHKGTNKYGPSPKYQ